MDGKIREAIETRRDVLGLVPLSEGCLEAETAAIRPLLDMVNEMGRSALLLDFKCGLIDIGEMRRRCNSNDPRGRRSR